MTAYEKQVVLLSGIYERAPGDMAAAAQAAMWYLNGGKEASQDDDAQPYRLYSFSKDANFIFAAFRQTHGIDLQRVSLHWWEFLALFMDLGQDTTFCQLIGMRKRVKSGTASKDEKAAAMEMGEMFEVPEPDDRTIEEREKEAEFMRLIGKGK